MIASAISSDWKMGPSDVPNSDIPPSEFIASSCNTCAVAQCLVSA